MAAFFFGFIVGFVVGVFAVHSGLVKITKINNDQNNDLNIKP